MHIRIVRNVRVPDPVRLSLYRKSPELGPRILFFSGGSALRATCAEIVRYSHNTIHLITPFDSGGSSAKLRAAFRMLAIGDVRNRLLALADHSIRGNPQIFRLFAHRFPKSADQQALRAELDRLIRGRHRLVSRIPDPMRKIIRYHLQRFREHMTEDFDLTGASIGNLILTGGYLDNGRHPDPVIYVFSKLVEVRGIVRPLVNRYLHLVTELADGRRIVGQHLLTGKEAAPIDAPVDRIFLSATRRNPKPARAPIRNKVRDLIAGADLICYPMGSFYSSIMANLLPEGVGAAIAANPCPKVFIPNTGKDPELFGLSVAEQTKRLATQLRRDHRDDPSAIKPSDVLNFVLMDRKSGRYDGKMDEQWLAETGISVIDRPLVTPRSAPLIDGRSLAPVLFSLA